MTDILLERIDGILNQSDKESLNSNANKDGNTIPVMMNLIAEEGIKHHFVEKTLSKRVMEAHKGGDIYIHDMGMIGLPITNCALVDAAGMMKDGFAMGNVRVESPKGLMTAANIVCQIVQTVSSNQYGGTTIPDLDLILEPYAKMSYAKHLNTAFEYFYEVEQIGKAEDFARAMLLKEIKDAAQLMEYQVQTMMNSTGQVPFVTFTFGKGESYYAREIQKAILRQRITGVGKDKATPVFPKLVFWHKEGLNVEPDSPNYDIKQLAVECTSKRMYPDHLSVDRLTEFTGGDPSPMGCRAFLAPHETPYEGRNNLGAVTVNIPRCALKATLWSTDGRSKEELFWEYLDEAVMLAKEALDTRIETCKGIQAKAAPILYLEGAFGIRAESPEEFIFDRFFANNRASISLGYIGLYDACVAMYGLGHHESVKSHSFAIKIVERLKKYTDEWKEDEKIGYTVYGTPAESLCGKFAELDAKIFGIIPNITDKGYVQNAFNVDVRAKVNPLEKIEIEKDFPRHARGGFISYGELPVLRNNLPALESIIDFALKRTPYYAINTPVDRCHSCGFTGDMPIVDHQYTCGVCGNASPDQMTVIKRVSGYLGAPANRPFPAGKFTEMIKRSKNM